MFTSSRKRRFVTAVICALVGLCVPACAAEVDDGTNGVDMAQLTLLEIQVDGARVSFVELEPGALVLLARQPSAKAKSPLVDPAVRDMNVLEKYEYWTKQPAPEVLRAAHDRSIALEREMLAAGAGAAPENAVVETAAEAEPETQPLVDKLLAEEFEFWHCGNVQKCHIYVTGDRQYETFGKGVAGAVNPIQGNVKFQLRYRPASGWTNIPPGDSTVYQNELLTYGAGNNSIIGRPFRATVYQAQYDIYNWAHSWW